MVRMSRFNFALLEGAQIVGFYPYETMVLQEIIEISTNEKLPTFDQVIFEFSEKIKQKAIDLGCAWENKVVVEILCSTNKSTGYFQKDSSLFIGWFDNKISIGISIWQVSKSTQERNIYFDEFGRKIN